MTCHSSVFRNQGQKSNRVCLQSPRRKKPRRAIVLAVVLAGMVLLLLMLGGMARRSLLEQRVLDRREQSLQADWLLWSAKNRANTILGRDPTVPQDWSLRLNEAETEKSITARVLKADEKSESDSVPYRIELEWMTPSGVKIERVGHITPTASTLKGTP